MGLQFPLISSVFKATKLNPEHLARCLLLFHKLIFQSNCVGVFRHTSDYKDIGVLVKVSLSNAAAGLKLR